MNKKKLLLFAFAFIIAGAIGTWYYVFVYSKNHHRDVADETAIAATADNIVKEYQADETIANKKYLDKAVEVTGEVAEVGKNQEGKITVSLKTSDAMTTVFCTMKDSTAIVEPNKNITLTGVCIGFLSDVRVRDAIIKK